MKTSAKCKSFMVMAAFFLFSAAAVAQERATEPSSPKDYDQGFRLGFGLSPGYTVDDPYDWSLGADVRLQYDFSRRTSITLTSGFTNLFVGDDADDLGFIPVKGGLKVFWWEDQFYAQIEAGMAFPVTNDYSDTVDNSVLLSPAIGWANRYFDLSLRYEHYNDFPTVNSNGTTSEGTGQIALRFAYGFRL